MASKNEYVTKGVLVMPGKNGTIEYKPDTVVTIDDAEEADRLVKLNRIVPRKLYDEQQALKAERDRTRAEADTAARNARIAEQQGLAPQRAFTANEVPGMTPKEEKASAEAAVGSNSGVSTPTGQPGGTVTTKK